MTLSIDLDDDVLKELQAAAERAGESLDQAVSRILRDTLSLPVPARFVVEPFAIEPFALDYPEKWRGLTPSQIDSEMEMEHYEEKRERSRHEHAPVRA